MTDSIIDNFLKGDYSSVLLPAVKLKDVDDSELNLDELAQAAKEGLEGIQLVPVINDEANSGDGLLIEVTREASEEEAEELLRKTYGEKYDEIISGSGDKTN